MGKVFFRYIIQTKDGCFKVKLGSTTENKSFTQEAKQVCNNEKLPGIFSRIILSASQEKFACWTSTIKAIENGVIYVQRCHFVTFIVKFEYNSHLFSNIFSVGFEHLFTCWVSLCCLYITFLKVGLQPYKKISSYLLQWRSFKNDGTFFLLRTLTFQKNFFLFA